MDLATIREMRDRFNVPIPTTSSRNCPSTSPRMNDPIMVYLQERRKALGGYFPQRREGRTAFPRCGPLGVRSTS